MPARAIPAKNGDGRVVRTGTCSVRSDWKLTAIPRDGRLDVRWKVDQDHDGDTWRWAIRHDGTKVASGRGSTGAPSGAFSVQRRIIDPLGQQQVAVSARNLRTGEVCRASAWI